MDQQLGLFPEEPPFYLVAVCPVCGPICKVEVKDGRRGGRWDTAEKWCYIARCEHDRTVHGTAG